METVNSIRQSLRRTTLTVRVLVFCAAAVLVVGSLLRPMQDLQIRQALPFFIVLISVILTLLFFYLRRLFVLPVQEMMDMVQAVTNGDLSKRITSKPAGELGELATSLNDMTETLQQRLQQLALLCHVSRELTLTLNLKKVLQLILENAVRLQNADNGSIMLMDHETNEMSIKAAINLDPDIVSKTRTPIGHGIAGWVAQEGKPLLLTNGINDPRFKGTRDVREAISVPILLKGKVAGVLNLSNQRPKQGPPGPKMTEDDIDFLMTLANQASSAIHNAQLFENLRANYFSTIQALAAAIDAKDPYTHGHSARVAEYAMMVAQCMQMSPEQLEFVQTAAFLHDVGKIGIPEAILGKPGRLTDEEYDIIKTHPEISARILSPVHFKGEITKIVRHHHENFDGRGYPDGLTGGTIPLEARILTVADSFDAMTSIRPYRPPRSLDAAKEELLRCSGTQFDPDIVRAFIDSVDAIAEVTSGVESLVGS